MNILAPIQTLLRWPRQLRRGLQRSRGPKKWLGLGFLALMGLNLLSIVFTPQPAHALLINDLTVLGRTIGDAMHQTALTQVQELYTGTRYGILAWISRNCLLFASPIVAVGLVTYLNDDGDDEGSIFSKPALLGGIGFYILLSGGGVVYGQLYLFVVSAFEAIIKQMDDFINLYNGIAQAKAYLAADGIVSASVAECQRFLGQEQQRCVAQATAKALEHLGEFKEIYPGAKWLEDTMAQLSSIANNILSPEKNLVEKAMNIWYAFNAPVMEIKAAAEATASITAFTAIYGAVIVFLGLAGPVMGLSSLLVPGLQSGWIAFVCMVFGVFYWRLSFLIMLWTLSEMLTRAPSSATISTAWFADAATKIAPILAAMVAGGGVVLTWGGITGAIRGGAYGETIQSWAAPVTQAGAAPPPPPTAPANSSGVRTDY